MKQRKRGKQFLSVLLAAALVAQPGSMLSGNNHKAKAAPGLSNPVVKDGVVTWDTVYFGKYWQRDTNGDGKADKNDAKESIRWRVLSVNGNEAFLLADQNLDCKPYNEEDVDVTWETCTLRAWLNQEFLQAAFTAEEQKAIPLSNVRNENNPYYDTEGGKDTADRVYLLSIGEASNIAYGFDTEFRTASETRVSKNTPYAEGQGGYTYNNKGGLWWLRSPGDYSNCASLVYGDGWGYRSGDYVLDVYDVVRPALKLSLSSPLWTKGDSIRASLAGNETPSTGDTGNETPSTGDTGNSNPQNMAITKAKIQSAKNIKGRKISLKFKKLSGAKGYQIKYATNKKFKKAKTKNSIKLTYTLKKLKKNKTYYIKARAYALNDKKKVYSKWSTVKKVKVKK